MAHKGYLMVYMALIWRSYGACILPSCNKGSPKNKFDANNDAAAGSFVSSLFHLAHTFVLVINLFWSFFCMVVHSFGR